MVTLGRAVERFPDAPQVYAALGHVWLTDAQRARRSRRAQQGDRGARPGGAPIGRDQRDLRRAWPRVPAGRRSAGRRARASPGGGEAAGAAGRLSAAGGRHRAAMAASRMRAMRLLKYATLVGDERPLATVATQIADYSDAPRRTGTGRAMVRSCHRRRRARRDAAAETRRRRAARRRCRRARSQVIDEGARRRSPSNRVASQQTQATAPPLKVSRFTFGGGRDASRRPSPRKLKPRTTTARNNPGKPSGAAHRAGARARR